MFKQYLKLFIKKINKFVIPLIIYIVLFFIFSKNQQFNNISKINLKLVVNDLDNSKSSKKFIEKLKENNTVILKNLSLNEAKKQVFENKISAFIEIKKDLDENLKNKKAPINVISDEKNINFVYLELEINKYFAYKRTILQENKSDEKINEILKNETNIKFVDKNKDIKNSYKAPFLFASYMILLITLNTLIALQSSFKESTLKRIKISALSDTKFILQQNFSKIIISTFISLVFIIFLKIFFKNLNQTKFLLLSLSLILFSYTACSLSTFLTSITNDKKFLQNLSSIFTLLLGFISGVFIDKNYLPKIVVSISRFLPQVYINDFLEETTLSSFFFFAFMQMLFIVFFLSLSILIRKKKTS